jgi:epoxide hydrolase 4
MTYNESVKFDYAQIGGVKLHYATAGEGEKLVVLLHGFPEFWYSWRHQIAALSDEYTVVAPDLRGYNLSDKPPRVEDYEMDKLVDDVIGLIHHFGRSQAAVIGHDWGAGIAWKIAQNHPETLWKVGALQVPPTEVAKKNFTFRQALASFYMLVFQIPVLPEWILSQNNFAVLKAKLKAASASNESLIEVFTEEDIAEYQAAWERLDALTGMINYYRANFARLIFSGSSAESDEKIKVPAVFIYGQQDPFILRETVKNIGDAMDAPLEEFFIPNSGHWVQQEAAETVTQILRDFLADEAAEQ